MEWTVAGNRPRIIIASKHSFSPSFLPSISPSFSSSFFLLRLFPFYPLFFTFLPLVFPSSVLLSVRTCVVSIRSSLYSFGLSSLLFYRWRWWRLRSLAEIENPDWNRGSMYFGIFRESGLLWGWLRNVQFLRVTFISIHDAWFNRSNNPIYLQRKLKFVVQSETTKLCMLIRKLYVFYIEIIRK